SVAHAEQILGPNHPDVAAGRANLANLLRSRHKFGEAQENLHRAEDIDRQYFPPDHPRIAKDLTLEAALAFDRKKFSDAEKLLNQALAILASRFPARHPEIGNVTASLAEVYIQQKRM